MVGISRSKIGRHLTLLAVFVVATGFGLFLDNAISYVSAQTPTNGMIYACIDNRSGDVQAVSATKKCGRGETNVKIPTVNNQINNDHIFVCPGCVFDESDNASKIFQGKNLTGAYLPKIRFDNSPDLKGANLTGANLRSANFSGASLSNVNLTNADLTDATITSSWGLKNENVSGVIWSNTTCPDGTNSDTNGSSGCEGHLVP